MRDRSMSLVLLWACLSLLSCGSSPVVYWDSGNGGAGGAPNHPGTGGTSFVVPNGGATSAGSTGVAAECGNGELEPGELCDDGGTEDGDGCSADCLEQDEDYACLEPGAPCVRVVICGSGIIEGNEACDDGNENSGDGCAADCGSLEEGWVCPRPGRDCVESPECGNGILERGEACDDDNAVSGDGCSGTEDAESAGDAGCQLEEGYWCPGAGEECVALSCGDGNRTADEECDDSNTANEDGCSEGCLVEPGWRCSTSGCSPVCGDGALVGREDCDDGDRSSGDGCSAACAIEPFWDCVGDPSSCESTIECGNDNLDPGEICDPPSADTGCLEGCTDFAPAASIPADCGNVAIETGEGCDPPGTGCSATCQVESGYTCPRPGTCMLLPVCGDGTKQVGEDCDVGPEPSAGCVDCEVTANWTCFGVTPSVCELWSCGDGTRQRGEDCDDGNDVAGDGCSTGCVEETGWHCSSSGCASVCGDGLVVVDFEECDDGNFDGGDGCSAACGVEPFWDCDGEPSLCHSTIECGNEILDPGEICDPPAEDTGCLEGCEEFAPSAGAPSDCGNSVIEAGETCDPPGTGCGATCQALAGYVCPRPATCVVLSVCGNGLKQVGEGCDDGNDAAEDGCVDCQVTPTWTCFGVEPSVCELWTCGDASRQRGEDCDDGNDDADDGCSPGCAEEVGWHCSSTGCAPICGDGLLVDVEECDDGNFDSGDGCSAACFEEPFYACTSEEPSACTSTIACDNGMVDPGEKCDPPSVNGCSADCLSFVPEAPEPPVCNNSRIEAGETCDPPAAGAGCDADCHVEPGFTCPRPGVCFATPDCGDGIRGYGEACDDNNGIDGDGCTNCAVDDEWVCGGGSPSVCEHRFCGDGARSPGEACDDGPQCSVGGADCVDESSCGPGETCVPRSGDGCSAACTVEAGWRCSSSGCQPICGDGLVIAGEEACDDGGTDRNDGCSAACLEEPFWACTNEPGQPSACTSTIECDNGVVEPGEICDPPLENGCSADCTSFAPDSGDPADCSNNIIEYGEECAPGGIPGCNATTCLVEPGYVCPVPGACTLLPSCGNAQREVGEDCDDGTIAGGDGCAACAVEANWICIGIAPTVCELPDCGDGVRQFGEECDDGAACSVSGEPCVDASDCDGGETCEGRAADGCSTTCAVEDYWVCPEEGEPCWEICGDGAVVGDEGCDDGTQCSVSGAACSSTADCPAGQTCGPRAGDGCNAACRIEPGWDCSLVVPGCVGPTCARTCVEAECGNGAVESGEGCDDGDITDHGYPIAGDGCGPTCQLEPDVTHGVPPVVNVVCGDGMKIDTEECDDGNTNSGDGCSGTEDAAHPEDHCQIEGGFECTSDIDYPSSVHFQVTYRDFKADYQQGGHPDFQWESNPFRLDMPGPACTTANNTPCPAGAGAVCPAGTCGVLDVEGKPVHHLTGTASQRGRVTSAATYSLWYRNESETPNDPEPNRAGILNETPNPDSVIDMCHVIDSLELQQVGGADSEVYRFDSAAHFPIGADCFGLTPGESSNFHFTTELRYFFQYRGGETLTFRGDDDVWVFINGRHAVDIGGVHGVLYGRVVLGDDGDGQDDAGTGDATDSDCSAHGEGSAPTPEPCNLEAGETTTLDDKRFGLELGEVYEIVLFHAERHTTASNFQLTLAGFLAPRSVCTPDCGDGIVAGWEVCDDGDYDADDVNHDEEGEYNSDSVYGACNTSCTMRTFCGDGVRQGEGDAPVAGTEACDNGRNLDTYSTGAPGECAPGCALPPRCGDGIVQSPTEDCDNGDGVNSDSAYGAGACTSTCHYGPYCGDHVLQGPPGDPDGPEFCDLGTDPDTGNGGYGPDSCWYDCQQGPYCGDGERNGPEECDVSDPLAENCDSDCTFLPYCGDGAVNGTVEDPEECDYGQFASTTYDGCTDACIRGPHCGDGTWDEDYEQCDNGDGVNSDTAYGPAACTTLCLDGPRCGDGVLQVDEDEACDNGFNEDTYAFDADSCGPGCVVPTARCGDGDLDLAYEACDLGGANAPNAYGAEECSTACEYGGYCGDGVPNGEEACDRGALNGQEYGDDSCGYDCELGPRCGDSIRNGAEECDGTLHCSPECVIEGYCGDGVVGAGEACDYGQFASDDYGSCTALCQWGPLCGDEHVDTPYEDCDLGAEDNVGAYEGCSENCMFGPRCGDGDVQAGEGEACDNGFNDDSYRTGADDECGPGCLPPLARCGDRLLDPAYEECDNGTENSDSAYGFTACTTACTFGAYCGDGDANGTEACDRGPLNGTEYGAGSCGYDCQSGPRCGDGIRNGPEQCDGTAHCSPSCALEPYCGDGVVGSDEACDYGQFASSTYGGCTTACEWGPSCGDGTPNEPYEECDLGTAGNLSAYDGCSATCRLGPRCGDGELQDTDGETCDNGFNDDVYRTGAEGECGPNCTLPSAFCGDGVLEPAYEECDNGTANSNSAYGPTACTTTCTLGAYCGDGVVTDSEVCDRGTLNGEDYGVDSCSYDCQEGPRCGDGSRNGPEECDGTAHCTEECTLQPYCGDGVRSGDEECDYGQFGSGAYGGCTTACAWGPRCGDGVMDETYEECDLGSDDNDGAYDGCTPACTRGPRCGDSVLQDVEGEACDNGFNDDIYASDADACGPECQPPPSCGDGEVQAAFELCDEGPDNSDTTYDGCATTCLWGAFCGDGELDPAEACDEGADNAPYSASGAGCSYDCDLAPYCGDGIRNGPEECDDGAEENLGGYGNCNPDCTRAPYCGDGHQDGGEQCDDGAVGSLSCTPGCTTRTIAY